MGKVRWDYVVLALLLVSLFWVRMELSLQSQSLSYDSYLTVRNVEHIQKTWLPLREDPLSITGAQRISNPVFDYLLAAAVLISPLAYKALPNLFMVLLLVPVYLLALRITQSRRASFAAVLLAGIGPVVFSSYLNTPASAPLAFLLLLVIIAMLHDPDKYVFPIIILAIALTFISPIIFVLVLALLAMIILLRLEGFGVDRRMGELFFFTSLLAMWFYVIIYKQALFREGLRVLWQNLPSEFAALSFRNFTFIDAINGLGVITFLLGTIGVYTVLFETKERSSYAVIGGILAVVLALLLRIIPLDMGLILLTALLAIMAGYGLLVSIRYLQLTKAPWTVYPFIGIIAVFVILSAALPALVDAGAVVQDAPSADDIETFEALPKTLSADAVLLVPVKEAAAVQYYGQRTTFTDEDFLLVPNGDELIKDVESVYTSRFATPVVSRASRMGFTHILLTRQAAQQYGRDRLYSEGDCIVGEPYGNAVLYRVVCQEVTE